MRFLRVKAEGQSFYHCVSRVVDRQFIFQTTGHGSPQAERFVLLMRRLEAFSGVLSLREGWLRCDRVVVIIDDVLTADQDCVKPYRAVTVAAGDGGGTAAPGVVLAAADAGPLAAGDVERAACYAGAIGVGVVIQTAADAGICAICNVRAAAADAGALGGGEVEFASAHAGNGAAGRVAVATGDTRSKATEAIQFACDLRTDAFVVVLASAVYVTVMVLVRASGHGGRD